MISTNPSIHDTNIYFETLVLILTVTVPRQNKENCANSLSENDTQAHYQMIGDETTFLGKLDNHDHINP